MLTSLRRFFARLLAGLVALVTLRLVEVNPKGIATAKDGDRESDDVGQAQGRRAPRGAVDE